MSPQGEYIILLQDVINAYDEYHAYKGSNFIIYSRADKQLQAARKALEDWRKNNARCP